MANATDHRNVPLAIVGMACRLPGADNLDAYWKLIVEGRSAIAELPPERLDQELYYDPRQGVRGKSYSKLGAILSHQRFDRQACPIPEQLEKSVDIVHLLMCEVAAAACRHAGWDPFDLPLRNTGVFIGHAAGSNLAGDYTYATCIEEAAQFLREVDDFQTLPAGQQQAVIDQLIATVRGKFPPRGPQTPDVAASMVAGTISKAFGLTGPFLALNSACASSLQAMLVAARALQAGRVDMAIVGGASDCKGDSLVLFSHAQTLSASGSRPFDADADGLVCSEGYVAVVMKTLARALADGDRVCAIVRGLGIASDGRGKSLWAPRKEGQIKAMERAYASGVDMAEVQYLEAHATATQLGDATELTTVGEVLQGRLPPGKKVPITSVKANIGHALEAAGLAGVIKTVLCMQHGVIPPAINVRNLNPKIDWDKLPVYVPLAAEPWPRPAHGGPRRAGVNAFGIGGLNMHVVLDEWTESARQLVAAPNQSANDHDAPSGPSLAVSPRGAMDATSANDLDAQSLAVVGMGCIFPGAADVPRFWELLASGRDAKSPAPADRWRADLAHRPGAPQPYRSPVTHGGYITDFHYDWRAHKIPPKQIEQADPLQFMLMDAADQALRDAGYDKKPFDRTRAGVVVGTEFGGDFAFQLQMALRLPEMGKILRPLLTRCGLTPERAEQIEAKFADVLLRHWPALVDESGSFSTSALASRISKTWDLMGGAAALDCGENSALAALTLASDLLLAGDCDLMVCAAGQRRMGLPTYEALALAGALAGQDHPPAPFDAQACGYLPGEGVGVLLLKRLGDARRDGDPIRAIVRGLGAAHAPRGGEALQVAIERSCASPLPDHAGARCPERGGGEESGLPLHTADIVTLEADGAAFPSEDSEALRAIAAGYGHEDRRQPLVVASILGQIGHTAGASGMASLLKAAAEIEHGESTGTVNLRNPLPITTELGLATSSTRAPLAATPDGRRLAGVSSCARGLAYHAILERGAKVPVAEAPKAEPRPTVAAAGGTAWRICRLGAASPDELAKRLAETDPASLAASLWAESATTRFRPGDRTRLAIVAGSVDSLQQKLAIAAKQCLQSAAAPVLQQQGIFCRQLGPARPQIVFLFAGQGSQYPGMLRQLIADVPAAAAAMQRCDVVMRREGYPTFAQIAWEQSGQLGQNVFLTQAAVLLGDAIVLAALADRGIRPDVLAGHSYGEYVALMAAGAWDFEETLRVTRARCDAIEASPSARGAMLAVQAARPVVENLIARLRVPAYVANHNAPDQTVVGGSQEALAELAALAQGEGHESRLLSVPCPFHTPLMREAAERFRQALAGVAIRRPQTPLVSVVTNRRVSEPEEVRANLVAHMTQPVRYVELIESLVAERETVLVEVGPQQALTNLHRRIRPARAAFMIASDQPKRPGLEPLLGVEALLDCVGALEPAAVADVAAPARPSERILAFDATARRREKMRLSAAAQPAATAERFATASVADTQQFHAASEPAGNGHKANGNGSPASAAQATVELPHVERIPPPPQTPAVAPNRLAGAELESFLINFVVEQTGYPTEVVELDADLEADLGIDSIKKAQLFGELREFFDVTPSEDLTLDDFPTLRHVLNFLQGVPIKNGAPAVATVAAAVPQTAVSHTAVPIAERQEAPVAVASPVAPAPVASIAVTPILPTPTAAPAVAPGRLAGAELESFLINFVVEQTGYPTEVVELDGDLEADLGIDSIKKAQLFGELREFFDVTPSEDLTLDDFPTLRHVLNFLQGVPIKKATTDAAPQPPKPAVTAGAEAFRAGPPSGTPYGLGFARGTQDKAAIVRLLRRYADLPAQARVELAFPPGGADDVIAGLDTDRVDELQGIADAVEVPLANVAALNFVLAAVVKTAALPQGPANGDALERARQGLDVLAARSRLVAGMRDCLLPVVRPRAAGGEEVTLIGAIDGRVPVGELSLAAATAEVADAAPPVRAPLSTPPSQPTVTPPSQPTGEDLEDLGPNFFSQRFVMRMLDAPLEPGAATTVPWQGAALVVGANAAADALRKRLAALGVRVCDLTISDDLDATLAAFDALWRQEPLPHVFLMAERDREPGDLTDESVWRGRRQRRVIGPYFLCQRWIQRASEAGLLERCTLLAATALGGDFGFSGQVAAPQGGAITGLIKALCIELHVLRGFDGLLVKAIDAPDGEPPDLLAENIVRELAARTIDYEVAFVGGQRRLQNAMAETAVLQPDAAIRRGGVWVVSGGARGITAACALELGRRFGLKLHLLGTSPLTPLEPAWRGLSEEGLKALKASIMINGRQAGETPDRAWLRVEKLIERDRALRAFAEAGVSAVYHQCDVADRAAVAAVLQTIRTSDGPIEGILHGAGIDRSTRFERKSRENVEATIGAKVDGAYHLMTLTRQDPVRHFIGFGSISGRLGSNGQTDYCVASDMLCKLMAWQRTVRPECRAVGFHWHPWDEVGMAARPETRVTFEITQGPQLMPKQEGLRHLLRELYAGAPRTEVLITDWDFYARFYIDKKRTPGDAPPATAVSPAPPSAQRVAQRHVLAMCDAPLPVKQPSPSPLDGQALILGENLAAAALARRLEAAGVVVHRLPADDDPARLVAHLEGLWLNAPVQHLFLLTGHDDDAKTWQDAAGWQRRRVRGVIGPFLVAQRWLQLADTLPPGQPATLCAVTAMGGDFGLAHDVPAPEGGMLDGLLKSLWVEASRAPREGLRLKVIDVANGTTPEALGEVVCRELAAEDREVEVGWSHAERRVVRTLPEPAESLPQSELPRGGVWVVTGGARGITAACALALAERYGWKLHLIGKSPAPRDDSPWRHYAEAEMQAFKASIVRTAVAAGRSPEEDWMRIKKDVEIYQTLGQFRRAGVRFTYHSCDISDWDALGRTLAEVRAADGPIEGILHGAGYAKPARFEQKSRASLERTVAAKVDGAVALMALTAQDPLRWFVGFGSLSGRFGGNGLSDYAAANDMLAKLIAAFRHRRPQCAATCVHWQTWDQVGMATLADGVAITKNVLQMAFIPPPEGIEHLRQELCAGLPRPEIVITDGHFQRTFYPEQGATAGLPSSAGTYAGTITAGQASSATRRPSPSLTRPLVESLVRRDDGSSAACVRFDPTADPFLLEHRLRDKPFLPGVIGWEALAEAASLANAEGTVVALRDVEISNGMLFHGPEPTEAQVSVATTADGLACALTSQQRDRKGRLIDAQRLHMRAVVELGDRPATIEAPPPGQPPLGWLANQYLENGLLYHGAPLRCLKQWAIQYDGGWARIVAPALAELAGPRPASGWILPPAVLDACLYACGSFCFLQFGGQVEAPQGLDRLAWTRQPREGESCILRFYFRGRDQRHSCFDFTLFGDDQRPLLEARGFRMVRIVPGG